MLTTCRCTPKSTLPNPSVTRPRWPNECYYCITRTSLGVLSATPPQVVPSVLSCTSTPHTDLSAVYTPAANLAARLAYRRAALPRSLRPRRTRAGAWCSMGSAPPWSGARSARGRPGCITICIMFSVCHPSVRVAVTMNVESIEACTDVHVAAHLLLALGLSLR
jgi:hypothetical protein